MDPARNRAHPAGSETDRRAAEEMRATCIVIKGTHNQGPIRTGLVLVLSGILIGILIWEFTHVWSGGQPRMSSTTHTVVTLALLISAVHIIDLFTVFNSPRN